MRLVARDVSPPHPEHVEKRVVETLRLALLVGRILPILGEGCGTGADFVPRQTHQTAPPVERRVSDSLPLLGSE